MLLILFCCLKRNTLEWYICFFQKIHHWMNISLTEWDNQLLRQYNISHIQTFKNVSFLKYHLQDCESLSIETYIICKLNLLNETEITADNNILCYIYNNLEIQLQVSYSIDDFIDNDLNIDQYCQWLWS